MSPTRRDFVKGAGVAGAALVGQPILAEAGVAEQQVVPSKGAELRALLRESAPVQCPAVHDVLTARLCEMEGFRTVIVGGSAASAMVHGVPDFGLVSVTELIEFAGRIAAHTALPLIADGDDGGGSPNNVYRATQSFERAGVAGIMYEDTTQVKHLAPGAGELVSAEQMADKIRAAVDARVDSQLVVVARCDALVEGRSLKEALDRGVIYAEAGADVLFFAGMTLSDTSQARQITNRPLMTTVGSATTPAQLRAASVSLAVYSGILLTAATAAAHRVLEELRNTGTFENSAKLAMAPDLLARLVGSQEYITRGKSYNLVK